MKILIISDVHANLEALQAVLNQEKFDKLFFLGDMVDYGPDPEPCINILKDLTNFIVIGNHDKALASNIDCGCSYLYKDLSQASRKNNSKFVSRENKKFLLSLPKYMNIETSDHVFSLAHASPLGDLYKYIKPDITSQELQAEIRGINSENIFLGHSHLPMIKKINNQTVVNPGSVGQPRDGMNTASYCIWEDGEFYLKRVKYDFEKTCKKLMASDMDKKTISTLVEIIRNGKLPY